MLLPVGWRDRYGGGKASYEVDEALTLTGVIEEAVLVGSPDFVVFDTFGLGDVLGILDVDERAVLGVSVGGLAHVNFVGFPVRSTVGGCLAGYCFGCGVDGVVGKESEGVDGGGGS